MRVAASLVLSLSMLTGACFPDNARHRTYAKLVEGGVALGGIGLLAFANTNADCMTEVAGTVDQDCEDRATMLSNIGLGMILVGLIGFIVTVSTANDDDKPVTIVAPKPAPPAPVPAPAPVEPAPAPAAPVAPTEPTPPTDPIPPAPTTPEPTPPAP